MRYQKRQRTTYTAHQLEVLHQAFNSTHYPEAPIRNRLAKELNLDPSRIQVWFQNKRSKFRKRQGISGDMDNWSMGTYRSSTRQESGSDSRDQSPLFGAPRKDLMMSRYQDDYARSGHKTTIYRLFDSQLANEAAIAVSKGQFKSIIDYHSEKCGDDHNSHSLKYSTTNRTPE